jgi:hypothetical protein
MATTVSADVPPVVVDGSKDPNKGKQIFQDKSDRLAHFSEKTIDSQELALARALNTIADKVAVPDEKKLFGQEMEGFKELFRRFKSGRGKTIEWDKIKVRPTTNLQLTYHYL